MLSPNWLIASSLFVAIVGGVTGCKPPPTIEAYKVKREAAPVVKPDAASVTTPPVTEPGRTLGAIVPRGEQNWFFKLAGPVDLVAAQAAAFETFVKSLTFDANTSEPRWTLPAGWSSQTGSGIRFATITITGPKPLELTVIPLGKSDDPQADLLANVNRWRGQMGVGPITSEALAKETRTLDVAGAQATIVDITGTLSSAGAMTPPNSGPPMQSPTPPAPAPAKATPPAADAPFAYTKPESWQAAQSDAFSLLAFAVESSGQSLRITASPLGGGGGDLLSNINRWRGQVNLPPTTVDQLPLQTTKVKVSGVDATAVELIGPADAQPRKAIFGAIATVGETTWFFKLIGDADLAQRERERFFAFLGSIQFR